MKKQLIKEYLKQFGTKVMADEDAAYVELMIDNHKCIKWYGIEYYIPENSMLYGEVEERIYEHLVESYHI